MDTIDRSLSEEQRMMRASCRAFVNDFVTPFIPQNWQREWLMDPDARLPRSILEQADRIGIRTLGVPEEFGGVPLDPAHEVQTFALISEEIARGDSGSPTSSCRSGKVSVLAPATSRRATCRTLVPANREGPGFLLAHCLTEPRGASDRWLPYKCRKGHADACGAQGRRVGAERAQAVHQQRLTTQACYVVYANTKPGAGMLQGYLQLSRPPRNARASP